nr:glycoside hydrolase family 66 protein [Paenibacillus sp. GSMTC-2017]
MSLEKTACRIRDIYPSKAQFLRGETVALTVELINEGDEAQLVRVKCVIRELADVVGKVEQQIHLLPHATFSIQLEIGSFDTECTGYGADAELYVGENAVDSASTAFDVVSNFRKATRYGFLSDFGPEECNDDEDVKWMSKLHLNLVQFYDWMYRHDDLVSSEETYTDLMGRVVSRSVVEEKIKLCHHYGMKAVAYGAVYAASKEFADRHPDWRLYTSSGDPFDFIGIFNIMNISADSPWHHHIVAEYRKAVTELDFDGIHMDTYGFPKTGWSRRNGKPRLERLEDQFPVLIESTREALASVKDDSCLIFNNVGNWPVNTVAKASQDAIYVEVWKPYERYHHLREIIAWAKHLSEGKPIILAAYLKPFRELGVNGVEGAEHGFRLLNAVVTAHGAYHLLQGEHGGVLTQGYYVDHSNLRPSFIRTVRDYCDFGVRYGHVTHDQLLRDVSMTHADGDNLEYAFIGFPYSTYGEAGKVWTIIREREGLKLIHSVNLTSASEDYWNESKEAPQPVLGRVFTIAVDHDVDSIFLASPDHNSGKTVVLEYRMETNSRGNVAIVELPPLLYWDLLIVKMKV